MARSTTAADVNIKIMRTFVRLRQLLAAHDELARKVTQHDQEIAMLFDHVQSILEPPAVTARRIGFVPSENECATSPSLRSRA